MSRHITSFVRSWLTPSAGYTPGASELTDRPVVRLDWNESPYPLTPKAQQALTSFTKSNRYPDYRQAPLRKALGAYIGVDPERVVPGAGLDDVLNTIAMLFVEPGDEVIIADPTFGVYRSLYALHGATIRNVPLGPAPEFELDVEGIVSAAAGATAKLIILCNPNNPTGHIIPREQIERVIDNVSCPVLIDEAYAEFAGISHMDMADGYEHVIVLRTLSKFAGLAGLRVGYGVFPEALLPYLHRVTPAFANISLLAAEIAIAALDDLGVLLAHRDEIVAERQRVFDAINCIEGLKAYPSGTNFILFDTPLADSGPILQALAGRDIFIRRPANPGLEHSLRVSIGTAEENSTFLDALADIMASQRERAPE
jgi:histidinol-phosphate aminotransferase